MKKSALAKAPKPVDLAKLLERAKEHAETAKAASTKRSYSRDWEMFLAWHEKIGGAAVLPISVKIIVAYIEDLSSRGRAISTIDRALVAISQAHKLCGHASPTSAAIVREVLKGLRREKGIRQRQAAPISLEQLRRMVNACPMNLLGIRDRALLLLGWTGALRRSELIALNLDDIEEVAEGLIVLLRRSKTDQEGAGRKIGIPFARKNPDLCAVAAVRTWIDRAPIQDGALFRRLGTPGAYEMLILTPSTERLSSQSVSLIVKKIAYQAGLNPALFSAHSLRAGLATFAAGAGVAEHVIQRHTGHRSERVLRSYIRDGSVWTRNPLIGLL